MFIINKETTKHLYLLKRSLCTTLINQRVQKYYTETNFVNDLYHVHCHGYKMLPTGPVILTRVICSFKTSIVHRLQNKKKL